MIRRAIGNLLSNAIRHCDTNGEVVVTLRTAGQSVCIQVENTGEEIPAEHLPRVFDRFYRADASRQRGSESTGLGLSITRSIVQAHQGAIAVQSANGRTAFEITLPSQPQG
jgi:two-component system heavy metal sensor histidine kinase CusS